MSRSKLIYRALLAVLILPVTVAGFIPVLLIILDPWRQRVFLPGLIFSATGVAVIVLCIKAFYKDGRGTLAPWDAPEHLVSSGPYRLCRNPMYAGVVLSIAGLALLFTSPLLLIYSIIAAAAFHLRVIRYEEPQLSREFGQRWTIYSAMTNRWLPKLW